MKGLIVAASIAVVLMVAAIALVLVNADGTATASQSATAQADTTTTQPKAESAEAESSPSLPEFMEERLRDLVERGFITEEQLDDMNDGYREHPRWHGELPEDFHREEFRERYREHPRWHGGLPEDFDHHLFAFPRFGPHGFEFFHGHADLLGLLDVTPEQLMDALAEGTPLIDLIDDPEAFLDSLLAPMEERLNQAVEAGDLTQAEADELLAEARTRAEAFINGEMAEGEWFMGRLGPRGFGDFGGFGPHTRVGSAA